MHPTWVKSVVLQAHVATVVASFREGGKASGDHDKFVQKICILGGQTVYS